MSFVTSTELLQVPVKMRIPPGEKTSWRISPWKLFWWDDFLWLGRTKCVDRKCGEITQKRKCGWRGALELWSCHLSISHDPQLLYDTRVTESLTSRPPRELRDYPIPRPLRVPKRGVVTCQQAHISSVTPKDTTPVQSLCSYPLFSGLSLINLCSCWRRKTNSNNEVYWNLTVCFIQILW